MQMMSRWEQLGLPNPGSAEARKRGCLCAVADNGHGQGFSYMGDLSFYVTTGCPLHAPIPGNTIVWELQADA